MADGNKFKETVESLFQGMDSVVSSKTVVGDAIHINGTIILPLVDVSFGIGAGSFNAEKKNRAGGGIGKTKLVNIKNQDTITKLLDMVPDVVDRFTSKDEKLTEEDVADILDAE